MSMEKLNLLLEGMNELRQVTRTILDRLDSMNQKLDNLIIDVQLIRDNIAAIKQILRS
ncbi:hypothetical protein J31TS6_43150 [Brevibacillus reuszeri]|uniref:hypothetical protein n=1 Tax=Brevibacillus reuszeri TaxID=54915 RepID=UPI001B17E764|nr:hypothetical protein [Brevibacillus reuszeri]GIO08287.1 hypothetical protein J31TS6_43150 [Brevibacillus reuszeri]